MFSINIVELMIELKTLRTLCKKLLPGFITRRVCFSFWIHILLLISLLPKCFLIHLNF